jgi:hypothetical protein
MEEANIGEALKLFQATMARTATVLAEGMSKFQERMQQVAASIQPVAELLSDFQQHIGPIFVEIARIAQGLPERTRQALATLANHGWYVDPEMDLPAITDLIRLFEQGETNAAHAQLSSYFDQRSETIRDGLCAAFSSRAQILMTAFKAHKTGEYELSVPVFLAQADGICLELTGVQLYSKQPDGKTTKVSEAIATFNVDGFTAALLHPLTDVFPIVFSSQERAGQADILNRHAVLHGESVSYGNLINSCKAISLLAFTAWALSDLKKGTQARTTASP